MAPDDARNLLLAIADDPAGTAAVKLRYADWLLEEYGGTPDAPLQALAVRWCAAKGKWPLARHAAPKYKWAWLRGGPVRNKAPDHDFVSGRRPHCVLPGLIYDQTAADAFDKLKKDANTVFVLLDEALEWLAVRLIAVRELVSLEITEPGK